MDRFGSRVLSKAVRLIEACRLAIFLPLTPDVSMLAPGVDPLPWPRAFADLRGLGTVSRGIVQADRLCGLAPDYLGMLQRQLARFFT